VPLHTRPIALRDRPCWEDLWARYQAFYGRTGERALPACQIDLVWDRLFDPAQPMDCLVAATDDAVIGIAHLVRHRDFLTEADSVYLQDLYVGAGEGGGGVGRRLIDAAASYAKRHGAERLYWTTHQDNLTARRLYDDVATHRGGIVYVHDTLPGRPGQETS